MTAAVARTAVRPRARAGAAGRWLKFGVLLVFALIVLIPMYVLLVTSFKPLAEATAARAWQLPTVWTVEGWVFAWQELAPSLANSLRMVIPASIISSVLGSLNGYVMAKWRFPHSDVVFTLFLFGMFIPYQAVMIPLVQMMQAADLMGTITPLVIAHVVFGIPICTLIFRNYYATLPDQLIEASRVDGAGMLRTYWSIILPNSAPAFAVTLIWQFTSAWNDFLFAVFLTGPSDWPVTVALNNLTGSMVMPYNQQMAAALLASLPTLLVYVFLGRFFMRGLMAGALKG
ncbi:carbohydrate ABC transporter permease [Allonocardiopsis opalescens]|uniref:Carbohydrate ABC transporter membrane protein 2 (CUT1 family) n=1 Tax=Allonocardiopsis opalescens TaxID=1144618 RepID=A0A2T0Q098_9ACTN|nr:carbohydrate ABC transporter permease [Allonocardiopsis opalescens]PRX97221.1 carbohydrate ABC transporter membrane protein 2 (CUT1 family) [Allonocardiopsis opalescens]